MLIVGGTPGAGKSSVARYLAARTPGSVHLEADWFYRFVTQRIDPSRPEAGAQNDTVLRAIAHAASAYRDGGYVVILDGVVGPWTFPLLLPILGPVDYAMLHATEDDALARARDRVGQPSAVPDVVARMHREFTAARAAVERHVIETDDRTVDDVADEVAERWARGTLRLGVMGSM